MKGWVIEIWNKLNPLVKVEGLDIHYNGENNLYPNECGSVISLSTTASGAVDVMARFLTPEKTADRLLVNKKKDYYLSDVEQLAAKDTAIYGGAFIWVGLGINDNGDIVPKVCDVLDYEKCRIQKSDDLGNEGLIVYGDWTAKEQKFGAKKDKNRFTTYRPYKKDQEYLKAELSAIGDGSIEDGIRKHKGLVYFFNPSNLIYPNSPFHSALRDCDTEAGISTYSNVSTSSGFLGKIIFVSQGLDEDEKSEIEAVIKDTLGTDKVGNVGMLNFGQGTDINEVLKTITIPSSFNDKEFTETSDRVRNNILSAAFNLPKPLVYAGDGAMFGTSGDAYEQYVKFYKENTKYYREKIEEIFVTLGFRK